MPINELKNILFKSIFRSTSGMNNSSIKGRQYGIFLLNEQTYFGTAQNNTLSPLVFQRLYDAPTCRTLVTSAVS